MVFVGFGFLGAYMKKYVALPEEEEEEKKRGEETRLLSRVDNRRGREAKRREEVPKRSKRVEKERKEILHCLISLSSFPLLPFSSPDMRSRASGTVSFSRRSVSNGPS